MKEIVAPEKQQYVAKNAYLWNRSMWRVKRSRRLKPLPSPRERVGQLAWGQRYRAADGSCRDKWRHRSF
jgi:hypothetical protein